MFGTHKMLGLLQQSIGWIYRHAGRLLVSGTFTLLVAACQSAESELPLTITEVFEYEGEEVVITRVVTPSPIPNPTAVPTVTPAPNEPTPPPPRVALDLPLLQEVGPLDPQLAALGSTNQVTLDVLESLYVGLTNYDHATDLVVPELATDWFVSDNGFTWTFVLRDDVWWVRPDRPGANLFTDPEAVDIQVGSAQIAPVSAEDVVLAVQRACSPDVATPFVFTLFIIDGCEAAQSALADSDALLDQIGVTAIDANTVQFRLTRPASYFLTLTTLPAFRPIPSFLVQDEDVDWLADDQFVSSGPFLLNPFSNDEALILQENPFWPDPFSGNVDFVNLTAFDSRLDAFEEWDNDQLDSVPLPFELTGDYLTSARIPPIETNGEAFYLGFNFDSGVFRLPQVRRAFSYAVDRQRLLDEVYGSRGLPMRHFVPEGIAHSSPMNEVGVGYSPSRALIELESIGLASCRSLGQINYLISSSDLALQHAESLQRMWVENLGCDPAQFEIEQVQFGTLLARTRGSARAEQRPDMWDLGWAAFYPDAHNWLDDVLHCENSENRSNRDCSTIDILIEDAAVELEPSARQRLYREVENLFFTDDGLYPVAPLYVRGDYVLRHPWVSYNPALLGGEQFDTYFIELETKEIERSQ